MAIAYVLINYELGNEEHVIKYLKTIKTVKEIHGVMGAYDIIAKVEAENHSELQNTIASNIRTMPNILSTLTLTTV